MSYGQGTRPADRGWGMGRVPHQQGANDVNQQPIKLTRDEAHEARRFAISIELADSIVRRSTRQPGKVHIQVGPDRMETRGERFIREREESAQAARGLSFTAWRRRSGL